MNRYIMIMCLAFAFCNVQTSVAKEFSPEKVLMVVTSHDKLGDTDKKTGFWLSELTHPYYVIKDAGYDVDVVSIAGGMAPIDPESFEKGDKQNVRFLTDATLMSQIIDSRSLSDVNPDEYKAVVFSGGHGTMWDFTHNADVNHVAASIYEKEGVVAAICHGPAALIDVRLSNGEYLVKGKRVAAFTNEEEGIIKLKEAMPFLLEDKLVERGAKYVYGKPWLNNVVVDGRIVTGQNPASAHTLGEKVVALLKQN